MACQGHSEVVWFIERGLVMDIAVGTVFDTPFEKGCVALAEPDVYGNFDGRDSEGVVCTFSTTMPLTPVLTWSDVPTYLGKIVMGAAGGIGRARIAHREGPDAGKVEVGFADGTTRLFPFADVKRSSVRTDEVKGIPVYPDAADGSSRERGVCSRPSCSVYGNIMRLANGTAPCTHCYGAGLFF